MVYTVTLLFLLLCSIPESHREHKGDSWFSNPEKALSQRLFGLCTHPYSSVSRSDITSSWKPSTKSSGRQPLSFLCLNILLVCICLSPSSQYFTNMYMSISFTRVRVLVGIFYNIISFNLY